MSMIKCFHGDPLSFTNVRTLFTPTLCRRNDNDSTFCCAPAYLKQAVQLDSETASRSTEPDLGDARDTCSLYIFGNGSCWKEAASVVSVTFWTDGSSAGGLSQLLSINK